MLIAEPIAKHPLFNSTHDHDLLPSVWFLITASIRLAYNLLCYLCPVGLSCFLFWFSYLQLMLRNLCETSQSLFVSPCCHKNEKHSPGDSHVMEKVQLWPWLLQNVVTGDSFHKFKIDYIYINNYTHSKLCWCFICPKSPILCSYYGNAQMSALI